MVHYTAVAHRIRNALLNPAWIAFLWAGMTIGVGMIATPARFAAETITRPIAIDVGRNVFGALNKAELAALIILLIVVRLSGQAARRWAMVGVLTLIVLAQSAWLLPELTARAELIISGVEPPHSYAHAIYSSMELVKIGLLFTIGYSSLVGSAAAKSATE